MSKLTLSTDQQTVLDQVMAWIDAPVGDYLTIGGYAGTGKTTLTAFIRQEIFNKSPLLKIAFCSYTGKAARNLEEKLKENKAIFSGDSVSTIHSLIYTAITNKQGNITGWKRRDFMDADLIIVDEASMVDPFVLNDLLSYEVPIVAVGDHGQLPPIGTNYSLMQSPHLTLTQIHRQEEDSPIIDLSILARTSGEIPVQKFGSGVIKISRNDPDSREILNEALESFNEETLIICGYNATRLRLNKELRGRKDRYGDVPEAGDRVVALKNNHYSGIHNGAVGTIAKILEEDKTGNWLLVKIDIDGQDKPYQGYIYKPQFNQKETIIGNLKDPDGHQGDLFDFGYALTVHKAQGSQADSVILFEERFPKSSDEEWRRWLYTAVTRAKQNLLIVG